ncbi:MAG: hypothetical protein HZA50_13170 [Planctomycetes bacterium]|nr:hypothetical protein [Planctomycetota bacterium]
MLKPQELRELLQTRLDESVEQLNCALSGQRLDRLEPVLKRVGRGGQLPHWYQQLRQSGTLPNLDGKTIGSVLEMLFAGVLEKFTFAKREAPVLHINPARGVDFPELQLGVKSPSENFCTSEPFFSAYERLIGNEHDALILFTDYQTAKKSPPLRLRVIKWQYLKGTQIADANLCDVARHHRQWLLKDSDARAQKLFRFLAYVNQSDWRAKQILSMARVLDKDDEIRKVIAGATDSFMRANDRLERRGLQPLPDPELEAVRSVLKITPLHIGVLEAADNWVIDVHKDFGRFPNDNEWSRLKDGPLDGKIGMSFALQWRYNFGRLFNGSSDEDQDVESI